MKVLILTPWFPNHPEDQHGRFILDSTTALLEEGHEVHVLVTQAVGSKAAQFKNKDNYSFPIYLQRYLSIPRYWFFRLSLWSYLYFTSSTLKGLIEKNRYDIVHAHTELPAMAAAQMKRRTNIPIVVTLHGISTAKAMLRPHLQRQIFYNTLNAVDRVVLVGNPLKQFYQQFVKNQHKFRVVANGFRATNKAVDHVIKDWDKPILQLISVSNLFKEKGIHFVLNALAVLQRMGLTNWRYTVVGEGNMRRALTTLSKQLHLQDQVFFLGACSHRDVCEQLSLSHVFILPSYLEAFGIAYLESMAQGCLAIGIDSQGPQDFIGSGKTGLLVPPKNVEALVGALLSIFTNREWARNIAEAGKIFVRKEFTWQQHAKKLSDIYQELQCVSSRKY